MSDALKVSLVGIDGNIGYSPKDVWAFYTLPTNPYDFETIDDRESFSERFDTALATLVTGNREVEWHLYVAQMPLNTAKWAESFRKKAQGWDPLPGFDNYMDSMSEWLSRVDYSQKTAYLAIKLGSRKQSLPGKAFIDGIKSVVTLFDRLFDTEDHQIPDSELQEWRVQENDIFRLLGSTVLAPTRTPAPEIALWVKKPLYPAMPTPTLHDDTQQQWGRGDVYTLTGSYISEVNKKWLEITQTSDDGEDHVGYRATLCIAKFPPNLTHPWIHSLSRLGDDHEFYSRGTLVPASKIKSELEDRLKRIKDEANNAAKTKGIDDLPTDIRERYHSARQLKEDLDSAASNSHPIVKAVHRIVVTASTIDELKDKVQKIISHYKDQNIVVQWTTGDQTKLLHESLPCDRIRLGNTFLQRQSLNIISGGMPTANSTVGD